MMVVSPTANPKMGRVQRMPCSFEDILEFHNYFTHKSKDIKGVDNSSMLNRFLAQRVS
jgi:hypothetical protein